MTYYDVLGVSPDAPAAEIRRAYVRLARAHHPDFHLGGDARERAESDRRMRELNEAWAVLGDDGRRRAYDRRLRVGDADAAVDPRDVFVPFDVGDDDVDPRDVPDTPFDDTPPSTLRRLVTVAPVAVFAASVVVGALGLVLALPRVVAFGVVLFVVATLLFLVVPLLALADAGRHERSPGPARRRR